MLVKHYEFEDGKYEVKRNTSTYETQVFRNSERWWEMEEEMKFCKFFHSMLNKIDDLEDV